jgi:uncharacterized protein
MWLEAYRASLNLNDTCKVCEYHQACGGGYLPHRWSPETRYDNPSVYCEDIKEIFNHMWARVAPEVELVIDEGGNTVPLVEALREVEFPQP